MNRRGILGAMMGAPIAGPAIAKEAVRGMASGQMAAGSSGLVNYASQAGISAMGQKLMEPDAAIRKAFKMGLISRETVLKLLSESGLGDMGSPHISHLDGDLQSARSLNHAAAEIRRLKGELYHTTED